MTPATISVSGKSAHPSRLPRAAGDPANAPASSEEVQAVEPIEPRDELTRLSAALQHFPELDQRTLRYHLDQSEATAADGYWHAAINEARSFLEALVVSMAQVEQQDRLMAFRKGKESQGGLRLCRRFLVDAGFLDANEDELLLHVYGIASAKGAHHGVTDAAWCHLTRRIVWTTAQYLLRRYETWRRTAPERAVRGTPVQAGPLPPRGPARAGSRWTWLERLWRGP